MRNLAKGIGVLQMNKKQALDCFLRNVWPYQLYSDAVAKREAWNNYTDYLCKAGEITLRQYESWTNPF